MAYTTADIRNIAITGHAGVGKTTLVEALLAAAGAIGRMGSVEEGNTATDFEPEEKEHKHSLNSALVHFDHEGRHFNLIDTPGFPDFIGAALGCLPAVETVCVVVSADKGIQTVTRRIMARCEERRLPRMIIVNKIEEHIPDLEGLLASLQEAFGSGCLPINLPNASGDGVVDLWENEDGEVAFSSVHDAHTAVVDQVVEVDEKLMEVYLAEGAVGGEQLHDAFEKALREGHITPILFVSARTGAGVPEMLHAFAHLCPSPMEGNPRPFLKGEAEDEWHAEPDVARPAVAHVFKVATDQFVGKLAMFKVHQGTIKAGDSIHVGDARKPVRLNHLLKIHGKEHKEIPQAVAGDIVGVAKVDELHFNSVLHTENDHIAFKAIEMPRPMYGLAIEAKSRGDEVKISTALHKTMEEDPTFVFERVAATNETVCRGVGELHMRIILERLRNRYKLDLDTKPPRIAYKETITAKADGHHRHKKQTGGAGQFGEVFLRVEPLPQDHETGFEFADETFGGSVPKQYMPAIEKGVRQVLTTGAVAGYPLTGVRVAVYDGKHHPVDSKEVAFVTAGKRAFIDAVSKARPVLLEPFVDVEITAPATSMGDINSDLSGKRGQVQNTDYLPGDVCIIYAKAPLSEMATYSSQLKSMTAGQGSYTMNYSHDERTPPNVQADIVAAYKPKDEED